MGLMMCDGNFVSRDEVALVPTPGGTASWKPVPHMEVIEAVTDVVRAHNWHIASLQLSVKQQLFTFGSDKLKYPFSPKATAAI